MTVQHKHIPDHEYLLILEKTPVCCVDVVIRHKGKFLMVFRKEGQMWWVPGGRVHKNESFWDAACRKAHEETGLTVRITKKMGSYEWLPKIDGKAEGRLYSQTSSGIHAVTTGFVAEVIGDPLIRLDDTSSKYEWFAEIDDSWHRLLKNILRDGVADA